MTCASFSALIKLLELTLCNPGMQPGSWWVVGVTLSSWLLLVNV
ncbi:hypothetical protein LINGRAHAP2_LOCUS31142 [Linum grandiflorum]